jgi:uncharacterized iron-regulated protein
VGCKTEPQAPARRIAAAVLSSALWAAALAGPAGAEDAFACAAAGQWIVPASGETVAANAVMALHSTRAIVLLGESHGKADHHRWQLHTIAALHGRRPHMVLGVEMLPRRAQPVLDRWVAGELTTAAFLEAVEWDAVWGFDAEFYLPLFHFARLHRVPVVALNVDRALVAEVGREGWASVSEEDRQGVSTPAPASDGYRRSLAEVYALKQQLGEGEGWPEEMPATVPEEELEEVLGTPAFQRFVEAQLTWDRAMAEVLARQAMRSDRPLVVGIIGRGHLENRWGVPHQLAALDVPKVGVGVLLPWRPEHCAEITPDLADTVFLLDEDERDAASQGPRLGIMVMPHRDGVHIAKVSRGGVGEAAGLAADDVIVSIGGATVRTPQDLTEIIRKQVHGTTLPLSVRRGSKTLHIVARFPNPPLNEQGSEEQ